MAVREPTPISDGPLISTGDFLDKGDVLVGVRALPLLRPRPPALLVLCFR